MTEEHPDLFALVRGEVTNAAARAAGEHLQACETCRHELAELAVGNAMLARAARTAAPRSAHAAVEHDETRTLPPLRLPRGAVRRRGGRRPAGMLVAAAVTAVALVGAGVVGARVAGNDGGGSAPTTSAAAPYASVALGPVEGRATGRASMTEEADGRATRMTITAPDLPSAGRGHFYFAWLLDPATQKMLPLGQVGPGGTASFDVSDSLLASYSAIDVSLQNDDGDATHSPTSVLRGSYAGAAGPGVPPASSPTS